MALLLSLSLSACDGETLLGNDDAQPLAPTFPVSCGADTVRTTWTDNTTHLTILQWCLWATDAKGRARPGPIGDHWNMRAIIIFL
jgi:hypothetical protein